jgi:hypothetical protein
VFWEYLAKEAAAAAIYIAESVSDYLGDCSYFSAMF